MQLWVGGAVTARHRKGPPSQRSAIAKNGHVQYGSPDGFFGIHTVKNSISDPAGGAYDALVGWGGGNGKGVEGVGNGEGEHFQLRGYYTLNSQFIQQMIIVKILTVIRNVDFLQEKCEFLPKICRLACLRPP